ncbi:MAG TPA: class I SAM-dependent methyltransferase [Dehalococcoidia bacterium]|nr:class I SAM-dependent methyltransferase [Dehalococcoidia bacterium]
MLTVDFKLLPVNSGERVLDVGCGTGRHSWYVCSLDHCSVYSMDIDLESLLKAKYVLYLMDCEKQAKGKWDIIMANGMRMPFRDATFDKIICSEMMEHVIDDEQGVRELYRVLKDGGEMAVSVPTWLTEKIYWGISEKYHTNPGGHIRIYRQKQLVDLLQRHNFKVYAIRHKHAFHSIYWLLRCLVGVRREKAIIPRLYHRFLVWETDNKTRRYRYFRRLESLFDPIFPKSLVVYVKKMPQTR